MHIQRIRARPVIHCRCIHATVATATAVGDAWEGGLDGSRDWVGDEVVEGMFLKGVGVAGGETMQQGHCPVLRVQRTGWAEEGFV